MPNPSPGAKAREIFCTKALRKPAGAQAKWCNSSPPLGNGKAILALSGLLSSATFNLSKLCLAEINPRHWVTACSTGDKALDDIMEAAIMTPGVTSCLMASQAPVAKIRDCSIKRKVFMTVPNKPDRSAVTHC